MAPVYTGEERRKRLKLAAASLLLAVPYVTWAAWAGGTRRLPSPILLLVVFILNFGVCYGLLRLYRKYLYSSKN